MPPVFTEQPSLLEKYASKISRTGYFFAAVLLHLIVGLMVAAYVVFPGLTLKQEEPFHPYLVKTSPPPTQPPPNPDTPSTDARPSDTPAPSPIKSIDLHSQFNNDKTPVITPGTSPSPSPGTRWTDPLPSPNKPKITHDKWVKLHGLIDPIRTPDNIAESLGHRENVKVSKFPVYLASYADGDWNCNVTFNDKGEIVAGSLPNLVAKIKQWSHGNIPGEVVPKPLDIGSSELLDKGPPFIFFTGHKDFTLTPQEIKNLAAYLDRGGCIWGDNALAGRGSRFDVAFRREMKRVVPDIDKDFEPVQPDNEIFTKCKYAMPDLPKGMNYYTESLEHLDIDGRLAIIYSLNDYSDMFTMRVREDDKTVIGNSPLRVSRFPRVYEPLYSPGPFLSNSGLFFRNYNRDACLGCDKLGMNIVVYLLTRFDDILLLRP